MRMRIRRCNATRCLKKPPGMQKREKGVAVADLQKKFAIGCVRAKRLLARLKSAGVVKNGENS